jgi:F0F1-type ATP synthase assembly protein I
MKYEQLTFSDLKSMWRIIAAIAVCQLVGSAIGLVVSIHHFWFMNFWFGGAAGTLPGFVFGVIWQLKSQPRDRRRLEITGLLGFISIAVTAMAFGVVLPQMRSETANLTAINRLQTENLQQIDIFDQYGEKHIACITDQESVATFAKGIADAAGHSPNHPRYSESWYVVVTGTTQHEFKLHLNPRFPQSVIVYCVVKSGNTTSYHGTFESKSLRPWVEAHLIKK